jgi:alkanesulfonate monooxygenase SsuD/methylene tetrahydromethanopterin reductase-like flavin-dependent oxidoreductase (luciferase family)
LLFATALSEETCKWAGSWADGLITTGDDDVSMTAKKIEAFKRGGGEEKPFYLQLSFSYARTPEEAAKGAFDQWRPNLISPEKLANVSTTEEFDELAASVTMDDVKKAVKMVTTIADLLQWISAYKELGASRIILHNIHPDQEFFVNQFGKYHAAYAIPSSP